MVGSIWKMVGNPHGLAGLKWTEPSVSAQLIIFFRDRHSNSKGIRSTSNSILRVIKARSTFQASNIIWLLKPLPVLLICYSLYPTLNKMNSNTFSAPLTCFSHSTKHPNALATCDTNNKPIILNVSCLRPSDNG